MLKRNLQKSNNIQYSSWDEWNAKTYLETYFSNIGPDSFKTLQFIISELKKNVKKPVNTILDFGAGPTIFASTIITPFTKEIHIADYLKTNLDEINGWLERKKTAFNWIPFIKCVLKIEGIAPTKKNSSHRSQELRKKIKKLIKCDASLSNPLGKEIKYPIVITTFCPDSATSSKEIWEIYMRNISSLVQKNGIFFVTALRNCSFYKSGDQFFPCANINEKNLYDVLLKNGYKKNNILIKIYTVPECSDEGFSSIMCARAINS